MATFKEFIKSPKGVATVIGSSAAAVGIVGFYLFQSRRRVISIVFDKPSVKACTPDSQGVTITITDGFGRPLANKEFTLQIYFDSSPAFSEPVKLKTGADGTWRSAWSEQDWFTSSPSHVDTDVSETVTWEVGCDGYTATASYTAVFTACTNFSLCCRWNTNQGYFCSPACPSGTTPC